jgi:H/ACA ribonucleoprotein complex non-core subunit NAF1
VDFLESLEDDDDDMEEGATGKCAGLRTKNEVNEDTGPVNVEHIALDESTSIDALGLVEKVMDAVVVIKAHTNGDYRVLDEGGLIVTEQREIVGTVFSFTVTELTVLDSRNIRPRQTTSVRCTAR